MAHQGYGFCEFLTEEDAEYACKIMNQIKLWGKPIRVNKVSILFIWLNPAETRCSDCIRLSHIPLPPRRALSTTTLYYDYHEQASSDKKQLDVGANLFIGTLDESVDERLLFDTFNAFGVVATTVKVRVTLEPSRVTLWPFLF